MPRAGAGSPSLGGRDQAWRRRCRTGTPGRRQGLGPRGEQAWGALPLTSLLAWQCLSPGHRRTVAAGSLGRLQTPRFFGQLRHGPAALSRGACEAGAERLGCGSWAVLHVSWVFALSSRLLALPSGFAGSRLPPACSRLPRGLPVVSPCSCPASATSVWPPVPLGPSRLPRGGAGGDAVATGAQQVAEAGGTPALTGPPHEAQWGPGRGRSALQTCVHVCVRACACVACVWHGVSAPGARCASGRARAPGLRVRRAHVHRHLHVMCPEAAGAWVSLWRTSVWTREPVSSAAPAAWRLPRSPLRLEGWFGDRCSPGLGLSGWPSGAMPTSRTVSAAVAAQFCGLEPWAPRQRAWRAPRLHGPLTPSRSPGLPGPARACFSGDEAVRSKQCG